MILTTVFALVSVYLILVIYSLIKISFRIMYGNSDSHIVLYNSFIRRRILVRYEVGGPGDNIMVYRVNSNEDDEYIIDDKFLHCYFEELHSFVGISLKQALYLYN